jgi:sn-glycerol 3-phosphate transport system permease protein
MVLFPVIYAFLISFMKPEQVFDRNGSLVPQGWTMVNYIDALSTAPLFRFMLNSLYTALMSSVVRILTASLAAYAFAFMEFPGKKVLFMLVLGTFLIPGDVVLSANYRTVAQMKLINTYMGMMITSFVGGMNIFMLRQSFKTFSMEIMDASLVDGCSNFRFFWSILLPSNYQTLLTVFITSFMGTWNAYLWPLLVTNKTEMRTVQVGVTMLNFSDGNPYGPVMAASMLVLVPALILFLIFRRNIIAGMMAGGVKG